MKKITITQYKYAGKKLIWEIKETCQECNLTTNMLKDMMKNEFKDTPVELKIEKWLDNIFYLFFKGGWHAPVVMVDNKVFSQKVIPDRKKLEELVKKRIKKNSPK